MQYDFSKSFQDNNETLLNSFLDAYTSHLDKGEGNASILKNHYKQIIDIFSQPFELEKLLSAFENLAKHEITLEQPYVIATNETYSLKHLLIGRMSPNNSGTDVIEFISVFHKIENTIAKAYLEVYLDKLLSINNIRINSISDLVDKNIIRHYEAHLIWLTNLSIAIRDKKFDNYPELNDQKCHFGKWLNTEAKHIIQNNSKFKIIDKLHQNLHFFGEKIQEYAPTNQNHIIITYLEKCEFLSLSIGTELALVENIIMNKKITKDALTGAMNRHSLGIMFESQYEISLATNNSFALAICDLDLFKKVNDSHGHIAGDKILKLFVLCAKKHIRNSDIIIRYGGEEFIIIIPAIAKEKAYEILENIRKEFEKSFLTIDERKVSTTVSIGLVEIKPKDYYNSNLLNEYINMADQKLYTAKHNGRNRTEVFY